ncbi:thiolase family protein [Candidatus Woesearchaeota archaeon]|nr:thiolase family protein [Candidatus Woesearchaeota archaeon]
MFIKGVGMTKFGIQEDTTSHMVYEAALESLNDADMSMNDIDAIVLSNMDILSNGERQRHSASQISSLFQKSLPIITVPAGCAGGGTALWTAVKFQKSGNFNNILVVGFDKIVSNISKRVTDEMLMGTERIYEQTEGMNFPAENALVAQQYMLKHGATPDDLALVAYKNHKNAFLNPKARFYRKKVSLEEIKNSPVVASPLRLFDCSIPVNGASSLILSKDNSDVEIAGSAEETDCLAPFEREDMTSWEATRLAAGEAYRQAGIAPNDIDIAEIHDAFTSVELISYEDLGFCKNGEGKEMIRKGVTNIDGKLPVNTSGGLKAKGHPISATGVSQVYEIVKQMRNEAGERQIGNVKYGLAQNIGGAGSTVSVHVLRKVS